MLMVCRLIYRLRGVLPYRTSSLQAAFAQRSSKCSPPDNLSLIHLQTPTHLDLSTACIRLFPPPSRQDSP